jgi:hypothetical protein
VLGGEFLKYMEAFKPFLGIGLKNYAEYQVEYAFQNSIFGVYVFLPCWESSPGPHALYYLSPALKTIHFFSHLYLII